MQFSIFKFSALFLYFSAQGLAEGTVTVRVQAIPAGPGSAADLSDKNPASSQIF